VNIKNFISFSNITLALLLAGIGALVFHSMSIREEINVSERYRFQALLLADELLHTSDDLTRMAQSYVITGKPIYKRYFLEILNIRQGVVARPLNYSPTHWHLLVAGKKHDVERDEAIPMIERFQQAVLNNEEYALLQEALQRSAKLVDVERQAFAAFEGLYDDGKGNFTVPGKPDRERAIQLLFGERYIAEKAAIMEPIQRFKDLFNERMQTRSALGFEKLERQLVFEMALIFVALIATMGIIFYTRLNILQPLAELGRQVAGVTREFLPMRYGRATSNEVAKLGEALAVADAEKRQLLENERLARNEAERASRLKDEFLATLSHELRTPLNAILGWSQLILSGNMKKEDIQRGLETIERNARAQNKLIEDLLEMSSIISGKVRLDMHPLDIAGLIGASIESVRPTAQAKGVILQKKVPPHVSPIIGDSNRLQQIFWNLLSNSIKFTPKGGKIEVVVQQSDFFIEISIHDSGLGISPDFMPFVFDRFRQGDPSLTRQHGGLGLGLAIVKQLVELHGGTVRAESPGTDQGATFIVNLPLTNPEDMTKQSRSSTGRLEEEKCSLAGLKVLVVDDELDARELIREMLTQREAKVIGAASAVEGLKLLKAEKPDVIISDISMPDKNGYQFIAEVRNLPKEEGGRTPAIALTAFAQVQEKTKAVSAGYQKHLAKPVDALELVSVINNLARQN
jgi:signal transduction histidine kinase/ActR/RegA family two-component response regulator